MYQGIFLKLNKTYNLDFYPSETTFERNLESLNECLETSFVLFCDEIRKKIEHVKPNANNVASKSK